MLREDIITIEIDNEMVLIARQEQEWLDINKQGAKTRDAYNDKNIVGSLAHQIVEIALENLRVPYKSFRTQQFKRGDTTDIIYENDYIDVKGTHGSLNEQYFFNQGFLVFKDQLTDSKIDNITHFLFVLIEADYRRGHIFGIIGKEDFLKEATPVTLKYENMQIRAFKLRPLRSYIFRAN